MLVKTVIMAALLIQSKGDCLNNKAIKCNSCPCNTNKDECHKEEIVYKQAKEVLQKYVNRGVN